MSLTKQIARNINIQIIGKIISTVLGLIVFGLVARYLGQTGYGQYTTIVAFLQLFGILVDFGLYIILMKKISEPGADVNRLTSNAFTLRLFSAIIFLGLAPLVVLFFPYPSIVKIGVSVTTFSFLFITLNQLLIGLFQKNLQMGKVALAEVAGRIILLGLTYLAIILNFSLIGILMAVVLGSFTNFIITFGFSRQLAKIKLAFEWLLWKDIIKDSLPVAFSIGFNLVYFKADTIILSLFKPQSVVGIYGASYKVLEILITFPAMFAGLILPLLAQAWAAKNLDQFKKILQKAFDSLIILAVPLALGTFFLAKRIVILVAGQNFVDSGPVLQILIFAAAIIFIGNLFGHSVVAINKQKQMLWIYLSVAIISIIGYFIFIPRFSYFGAAGMTVLTELLVTLSASILVLKATKISLSFKTLLKALAAGAVMSLLLFILSSYNLIILIAVGMISYGLTLYLLKGISRQTIKEIASL